MGCKGSKAAEAPKSEVASSTLLTKPDEPKGKVPVTEAPVPETIPKEVGANATEGKAEEIWHEVPATQGSAPETTTSKVAATTTLTKTKETMKEDLTDAIAGKAQEAAETQGAPESSTDATLMKAEELKREEAAAGKGSATGLPVTAGNDEMRAAPEEALTANGGVLAEKAAVADDASKAEATGSAVLVAAADAAVAGKHGGCLSYCTATEAQTEIVVHH